MGEHYTVIQYLPDYKQKKKNLIDAIYRRVGNWLFGFSSKSLVFCERKSKIVIRSFPMSESLFRSFVKSDKSDLLMVALL